MAAFLGSRKTRYLRIATAPGWVFTHRLALALLLAILLVWSALLALVIRRAALPDEASGMVAAVFSPSMKVDEIFAAILGAHGVVVRETRFGNVWIIYSDEQGFIGRLRAQGAWAAFTPTPFDPVAIGGCFSVTPQPRWSTKIDDQR